ncbi:hemolysin family protein [Taklimakanibacter lacteus]|uniref:hemolysin family protein n=1 Tax=Taklimakanibacter lacteus TaxID=2268456 RepID=UPI000E66EC67
MPLLDIIVVLVLILINGLFAMSELAVVSARRPRLKTLADRGVKGARRALVLAANPGRFLSAVQIGITLVGILAGAYSGASLGDHVSAWFQSFGMSMGWAEPLGLGLVVALITYLSLIIGELVPKQLALRNAERVACVVAPFMTVLSRVMSPIVSLLDASGRLVLFILRRKASPESQVTEEEIRTLVAEAETAGVLGRDERQMISGVMQLGDRPVRAVMTPRHDVDVIDLKDTPARIRKIITDSVHSRLPVSDGDPDVIIGIIQAKDMLNAYLRGRKPDPRKFVRQAPVIPDTMDALDVVAKLKDSPVHVGLVHDEFGHFEGVVTSADILEAIVGSFHTEEGPPEPHATERDDGSWLLAGSMPIDELMELLSIPLPERRVYHTVAGLMLERFGRLPKAGEHIEFAGWRFEIVDLDGRRIDKVVASRPTVIRRKVPA